MDFNHASAGVQMLPYLGVLIAAAVEGELSYIGASALVAHGELRGWAVLVAGAAGAAIGDQAYFYAFRGRLPRWMARFPALQQRCTPLVRRVRRHASLMVLLIRFSPGLRIALTAACVCANISPPRFSLLNLLSAVVWASALMVLVGWLGPTYLARFGLGGWKGALLAGAVFLLIFKALGRAERRALERPASVDSQ
jgi:membrane protein DedA with SNARE-associated domain